MAEGMDQIPQNYQDEPTFEEPYNPNLNQTYSRPEPHHDDFQGY
jgi:hypothetical protein